MCIYENPWNLLAEIDMQPLFVFVPFLSAWVKTPSNTVLWSKRHVTPPWHLAGTLWNLQGSEPVGAKHGANLWGNHPKKLGFATLRCSEKKVSNTFSKKWWVFMKWWWIPWYNQIKQIQENWTFFFLRFWKRTPGVTFCWGLSWAGLRRNF